MNPLRHPAAAFSLVSHKLLRYGAFVFMPVALMANAICSAQSSLYGSLFVAQGLLYVLGLVGLRKDLPGQLRALTVVPTYFMMSNAAFAVAVVKFLRGQKMATWQPRAG